ncbi:MAG: hypothetical protein V3U14_12970 [candidate division NC10 bacterium]
MRLSEIPKGHLFQDEKNVVYLRTDGIKFGETPGPAAVRLSRDMDNGNLTGTRAEWEYAEPRNIDDFVDLGPALDRLGFDPPQ